MKAIGIFCGSSSGENPLYIETARYVGKTLAAADISIVYGGGKVGLMGAVADACLAHGGHVVGVMPRGLFEKEIAHKGLSELHVVENMHERKTKMAELSDGFIALPGGAGTLEEIFEQWTWAQLGIHHKPCAFLNINGYYDPLQTMVDKMVTEGFMHARYADMLPFATEAESVVAYFRNYQAPASKWVKN